MDDFLHLATNTRGRDFIAGDIHGHIDILHEMLEKWHFDKSVDRLLLAGDLIDRGPYSRKTLELVFEPWVFSCRGNHEMEALNAANGDRGRHFDNWIRQGGDWFLEEDPEEAASLIHSALARMPWAMDVMVSGQKIGIVHAEPPQDWNELATADKHALIWERSRIYQQDSTPVKGVDHVFVGHTPVKQPVTLGNTHWIDTGCYSTGNLFVAPIEDVLEHELPFSAKVLAV